MKNLGNPNGGVNKDTLAAVQKAAEQANAVGLCNVPPAEDGSKRPSPNASGKWECFKTRLPTSAERQGWYPGRSGIGIVTGAVSNNAECWDFDDRPAYQQFITCARECGLGETVTRIEAGYCDDTPGTGVRWLVYRPADTRADDKDRIILARRPKREDERAHPNDKVKILIEMPRYAIVAPTNGRVHPTGKPYVRRSGSFETIATYSAEERGALIELARSFDGMPLDKPMQRPSKEASGGRPGDDYISRTTWSDVLEPAGWKRLFTRGETTSWRRPGKKIGISATTNHGGADLLYVFTSSSNFEAEQSYNRFGAYTVL